MLKYILTSCFTVFADDLSWPELSWTYVYTHFIEIYDMKMRWQWNWNWEQLRENKRALPLAHFII